MSDRDVVDVVNLFKDFSKSLSNKAQKESQTLSDGNFATSLGVSKAVQVGVLNAHADALSAFINSTIGAKMMQKLAVIFPYQPTPLATFTINSVAMSNLGGVAVLTVLRGGDLTGIVSVDYATEDGSATVGGEDYTPDSGTLTFLPDQTSTTVSIVVAPHPDALSEGAEQFSVVLSNPDGGSILNGVGNISIDPYTAGTFSIGDGSIANTGGTVPITVTRTGDLSGTSTVDYATADGTAMAGTDYTSTSGTLSFAPTETTKIINITVAAHSNTSESLETFKVILSNPVRGIISDDTSVVSIAEYFTPLDPDQNLSAIINVAGTTYTFLESAGTDLGNFVGATYTQSCKRVTNGLLKMSVYFRRDLIGPNRFEVVFELGGYNDPSPANLGAYTATIYQGTTVLNVTNIPKHWWHSRWRWQSAIRPIIHTCADLAASKLIPPLESASAILMGYTPYTPMGAAGLVTYMPQSGQTPDMGMYSRAQGNYYVSGGDATSLTIMRDQAEASGSMPWHMRDPATGAPFTIPDSGSGVGWNSNHPANFSPYIKSTTTDWTLDSAHEIPLAYLPYLLTEDPYYLEEVQFAINWNLGSIDPVYRNAGNLLPSSQGRAFSWSLRELLYAIQATPDTVPSWLQTKVYFNGKLTRVRGWIEPNYTYSVDAPLIQTFRAGPPKPSIGSVNSDLKSWQSDFLVTVFAYAVWIGYSNWLPTLNWKIGQTIARNNDSSGWKRNWAAPNEIFASLNYNEPWETTWTGLWLANYARLGATLDGGSAAHFTNSNAYWEVMRGALAMASLAGIPAVDSKDLRDWVNAQIAANPAGFGSFTMPNWRIAP